MYKRKIMRKISLFICIILLHIAGFLYFSSVVNNDKNIFEERLLIMLLPENNPQNEIEISIQDPIINSTFRPAIITVPMSDIVISNASAPEVTAPSPVVTKDNSQAAEPPPDNRDATIFDPRLRKRLGESVGSARGEGDENLRTWVRPSGAQIVAVGDGKCIKSMPKLGDERGTRWSLQFACSKSDSEVMADEISRNLRLNK